MPDTMTKMLTIAEAQAEFSGGVDYLNTAAVGLPPRRSIAALTAELERWAAGRADAQAYDAPLARARSAYAALVGVGPDRVAVGSQVSSAVGLIAAAVPDGARVLTVADEFTSVSFPFLAQARRGVTVHEVPAAELPAAITPDLAMVAVAAVQSADGQVLDLEALASAADAAGVPVLLDLTQAAGWLPVDADRFAVTVCGGYKWLLAPRGTCFTTLRPELLDWPIPHAAGWYAGGSRWESIYGTPLRLAADARRFDVSPAWHSWIGQAESLDLLSAVGVAAVHGHDVALANRFRTAYGLAPSNSAIVSVAVSDDAHHRLAEAGIRAGVRAGRLRLAFHLYNTDEDADRAAAVLAERQPDDFPVRGRSRPAEPSVRRTR